MKRLIIFLLLLGASLAEPYSSNYAEYHFINEDETTVEIRQSIGIDEELYYFPVGGWESSMYLPKNIKNLKVRDNSKEILFNLTTGERYDLVAVANEKEIYFETDYYFNITYVPINRPLKYQNVREYIHPCLYGKNNDKDTRYEFTLPQDAIIIFTSVDPKRIDAPPGGRQTIIYDITNETLICEELTIRYLTTESSELTTFKLGNFTIEAPSDYNDTIYKTMIIVNERLGRAMEIFSAVAPQEKFFVRFTPLNETLESNDTLGTYTGEGKINIASKLLAESNEKMLQVLLHELVHSFDSFSYSFWWNEGLADAVSHYLMSELGYNITEFKEIQQNTIDSWRHCGNSFSFIKEWNIVDNITIEKVAPPDENLCRNYPVSQTAYAYSGYFINELIDKYGISIITNFYSIMLSEYPEVASYEFKENITEKIGFILDKSVNGSTQNIFKEYEFGTGNWNSTLFEREYEEFIEENKSIIIVNDTIYVVDYNLETFFSKLIDLIKKIFEKIASILQ